jgi:hypothetical protein
LIDRFRVFSTLATFDASLPEWPFRKSTLMLQEMRLQSFFIRS